MGPHLQARKQEQKWLRRPVTAPSQDQTGWDPRAQHFDHPGLCRENTEMRLQAAWPRKCCARQARLLLTPQAEGILPLFLLLF